MKQDNAIRKILSKKPSQGLPYGFDMRVMREVVKAAERKQHRSLIYNYVFVSLVSLLLVGVGFYLIKFYWNFNFKLDWPSVTLFENSIWLLSGTIFISVIALFLLVLDFLFRKWYQRKHPMV